MTASVSTPALTADELKVLEVMRGMPFGTLIIHLQRGIVVRLERNESLKLDDLPVPRTS